MIDSYITNLTDYVINRISKDINNQTLDSIVKNELFYHFKPDNRSYDFHKYYTKITGNTDNFLYDPGFFGHFKYQYAIQGVDNNLLNKLESNKPLILDYIEKDQLVKFYNEFFSRVETKSGTKVIIKDFGSFFTKVAHTIKPDLYCALDNQIKNYFNLGKESYFISFCVVSNAYRNWSADNTSIISALKESIKKFDKKNILKCERFTELKILDLIFWFKANE